MKKIHPYLLAILCCLLLASCNDEWKDELYEKSVSFGNPGYVDVYVKYGSAGGVTPYKVPVLVNGSTKNNRNINVTVAIDSDTLTTLNFERFRYRTDLYFKELDPSYYAFESMTTTIPKDENVGLLNLNLMLNNIDMVDKYILPLTIASTSEYGVNPRKYYKKTLMNIIPFNDYSGVYSASAGYVWDRTRPEGSQTALTTPTREARVVDENTIFFYAGVTEEKDKNRATYKLKAKFDVVGTDSVVTLTADSLSINFSQQKGTFTIKKEMDPVLPYLEKTYVTMYLGYEFDDITNPAYPLKYRFKGSMTLERKRNILIPDEDQQIIF